jgi:hypothetical protein
VLTAHEGQDRDSSERSNAMSTDEEFEAELGAVFDGLINLIGETKQAVWTASSSERRQTFDNLKSFLVEQAAAIDDAERRIGTRPPWVRSPTAHRARTSLAKQPATCTNSSNYSFAISDSP